MIKLTLISRIISVIIIVFTSASIAQSDYETVQDYKKDCEELEQYIKTAISSEDLDSIPIHINNLRTKYSAHSVLIDKALFPEKFQRTIARLNEAYDLRNQNFIEVYGLRYEISVLRARVDTLSAINAKLLADLENMESQIAINKKETARLNKTIADLKHSLQKRDLLVMNMVDSLLPPVMREKPMLSPEDKLQISSDIERGNILVNIKTTMRDNIKYLDLTSLQAEDISEILNQQSEFSKTWAKIGPRLLEVYSDDKNRAKDINEIDSLLTAWTAAVKQEAWESIQEVFAQKGMELNNFSDGEEFTNSVNSYIQNEKRNIQAVSEEDAKHSFVLFVDNTWAEEIEDNWTPFLIEHGMLEEDNVEAIDENIDVWRSELYPLNWWLWILILGVFSAGLFILLTRLRKTSQAMDIAED